MSGAHGTGLVRPQIDAYWSLRRLAGSCYSFGPRFRDACLGAAPMEPDEDEPPGRNLPRAVIKLGGDMLCDAAQVGRLFAEVGDLCADGWEVVVVHGGGPQTRAHQELSLIHI